MKVKFFNTDDKENPLCEFDCSNFEEASRLAGSSYWTPLEFKNDKYDYVHSVLSEYGYIKVYVKKSE